MTGHLHASIGKRFVVSASLASVACSSSALPSTVIQDGSTAIQVKKSAFKSSPQTYRIDREICRVE